MGLRGCSAASDAEGEGFARRPRLQRAAQPGGDGGVLRRAHWHGSAAGLRRLGRHRWAGGQPVCALLWFHQPLALRAVGVDQGSDDRGHRRRAASSRRAAGRLHRRGAGLGAAGHAAAYRCRSEQSRAGGLRLDPDCRHGLVPRWPVARHRAAAWRAPAACGVAAVAAPGGSHARSVIARRARRVGALRWPPRARQR
ncbi:hypothetical protein D3C85_1260710 [compost metagenome]